MSRRLRSVLAAQGSALATQAPPPTVASAGRATLMPSPLVLDLVAALVQGGAPPRAALRSVGAALQSVADPRGDELLSASARVGRPISRPVAATDLRSTSPGRLTEVVEESLWLAAQSGLPPTSLIRRSAAEERRRQTAAQARAVRRLEVLLVIPAGLCLLPAFVLLGIVPVVLDLVLG